MKNGLFAAFIFVSLMIACSKREPAADTNVKKLELQYDTTAIDSFSAGAISVDVARQIRMSSQKYQDSLKEVIKNKEEESRLRKEIDKEAKADTK